MPRLAVLLCVVSLLALAASVFALVAGMLGPGWGGLATTIAAAAAETTHHHTIR